MMVGLGIGLVLGVAAVGTSFAAQLDHSAAPVGCASVPTGGQPVGCASHPGKGTGDANQEHTGASGACPPGQAKAHQLVPVGCASRPGKGYGDPNHDHTGAPGTCPPGLTKGDTSPAACATRPGNGYGDRNHHHTGAPGQLAKHPAATAAGTNPPAAQPASSKHAAGRENSQGETQAQGSGGQHNGADNGHP
jgi:hypothetical protein